VAAVNSIDPTSDAGEGSHSIRVRSPLIEFHLRPDLVGKVPEPYPASKAIPEWFRQMPMEAVEPGFSTVKRCPPFIDAMTCGYILPVPTDITLSVRGRELDIEVAEFSTPMIQTHNDYQFPGAPFGPWPVLKFINPWIVKTPPGYATLFVGALNRFELPVMPLAGVVDTDVLYQEVHFPTLLLLGPGASVTLKRGMPLVQAILFAREAWTSRAAPWDDVAYQAWRAKADGRPHSYKEDLWKKKSFS
jgi:hypothetical protein